MKLTKPQTDLLVKLNEGWELIWSYDSQRFMVTKNEAKWLVDTRTVHSLRDKGLLLNYRITPMGKLEIGKP